MLIRSSSCSSIFPEKKKTAVISQLVSTEHTKNDSFLNWQYQLHILLDVKTVGLDCPLRCQQYRNFLVDHLLNPKTLVCTCLHHVAGWHSKQLCVDVATLKRFTLGDICDGVPWNRGILVTIGDRFQSVDLRALTFETSPE